MAGLIVCQIGSFGDCSELPDEAPKDERVVRFVGQPAGVVVRQDCARLQMWQPVDAGIYIG